MTELIHPRHSVPRPDPDLNTAYEYPPATWGHGFLTGLFLGILLAGGVALWRERANIEHQQRAIIHQIESGKGPRR